MDHKDLLFRFFERLYENSPWLFWNALGFLCGCMFLLLFWASVAEAIKRSRHQQIQESKANHRLFFWMRVGRLIALYVALIPVVLVILVVLFFLEDFKVARQILLESSETKRQT